MATTPPRVPNVASVDSSMIDLHTSVDPADQFPEVPTPGDFFNPRKLNELLKKHGLTEEAIISRLAKMIKGPNDTLALAAIRLVWDHSYDTIRKAGVFRATMFPDEKPFGKKKMALSRTVTDRVEISSDPREAIEAISKAREALTLTRPMEMKNGNGSTVIER